MYGRGRGAYVGGRRPPQHPGPGNRGYYRGAPGRGQYGRGGPRPRRPILVHKYTLVDRSITDLCHRYPRLSIPPTLLRVKAHLEDNLAQVTSIPFEVPLTVTLNEATTVQPPVAATTTKEGPKVNIRVMLLSGRPQDASATAGRPKPHLLKTLKFIIAKNKAGTRSALGGQFNPAVDGDSGSHDALVAAAIRIVKEQCGCDLSGCDSWLRILDVEYRRENQQTETSIFLVPNVWSLEDKKLNLAKQVQGESTGEGDVKVEAGTDVLTFEQVTLQALTAEEINDPNELFVEASLFGEVFSELISYKYGSRILKFLQVRYAEIAMEQKKRALEAIAAATAPDAKKQKVEDEGDKQEDVQKPEGEKAKGDEAKEGEDKKDDEPDKKKEEEKKEEKTVITTIDDTLVQCFSWFERPVIEKPTGTVYRDRMETMLHSLGGLCTHEVNNCLRGLSTTGSTASSADYVKLATTVTTQQN